MGYSLNLNHTQVESLIHDFLEYSITPSNNYTLFQAKYNTCTITIYKTHTLLIQGKSEYEVYSNICKKLNVTSIEEKRFVNFEITGLQSLIGTDEVGTGDFFGGIVVCGAFIPKEMFSEIKKLGVKDSKELSDYKISQIAPILKEKVIHSVVKLDCMHFNFLSTHNHLNMNNIKSLMHNSVILQMKQKVKHYDGIIIDGFTTQSNYFNYLKNQKNVANDVILEEKAENKYLSVACASIIARYEFLKMMEDLSSEVGFELPKGAGKPVDTAIKKIFLEKGLNYFKNISKMNFKNLEHYKNS